ncbi:hypothetical protein BDZ97DRAFT_1930029 [Flammula alnicola]|nr:hypothetical protein BDZ97DRAFT_1930029 [Flammula alnicola]
MPTPTSNQRTSMHCPRANLLVNRCRGAVPNLASLHRTSEDPRGGFLYLYGGLAPGPGQEIETADFYRCETETMMFTDLTKSLVYTTPGDPFSRAQKERTIKPLPRLSEPGFTLHYINDHPIIFLFGGYNERPSSALIAIETQHQEWWYVDDDPSGLAPGPPRVNPVIIGVGNRLFIFGGYTDFGDHGTNYMSYSIAEFQPGTHKCKWIAVDVPYPADILALNQTFDCGVAIGGGTMIVLTPGRLDDAVDHFNFLDNKMVYFFITDRTFRIARPTSKEILPKEVHWYYACNFVDPQAAWRKEAASILICGWVPYRDTPHLVPQLWRFFIYPGEERVVEVGKLGEEVWKLDMDLRWFAMSNMDTLLLLGQKGDPTDSDDENPDIGPGAKYDTYVKIPFKVL